MKYLIKKGTTSYTAYISVDDSSSTTGAKLTGLVFNSGSLVAYYVRQGGSATAITLATLAAANSAFSSGGFKEVDSTNMSGVYRLDIPDAAIATGANNVVIVLKGAANMAPVHLEIELTDYATFDVNVGAINGATAAAIALALSTQQMYAGTVTNAGFSPTTTQFETSSITTAAADHWVGRLVIWTSGTLVGQVGRITAYALNTGRGRFTVTTQTAAPANTDSFLIV